MAVVNSRQTLIDHCLRRLGAPVIEINVDDDQIEDKVDDALQFYQEYHVDASRKTFIGHIVTADELAAGAFNLSESGRTYGEDILSVTRMLPITSSYQASRGMFDVKYQLMMNDMANMNSFIGDLAYYHQMQQYLGLLDDMLNGAPQVNYSRKENKVYIYGDIADGDIKAGDYIVFECYRLVNPDNENRRTTGDDINTSTNPPPNFVAGSLWNDMFLKDYVTQLIKQQWGMNLIKFDNMILPGGVTLNGRQMYDDASAEIEKLRENMRLEYEFPPDFYVG